MDEKVPVKDIEAIISYIWEDEQKDYRENKSDDHIYCSLKRVRQWIKSLTQK